jgi:hypothetical protein
MSNIGLCILFPKIITLPGATPDPGLTAIVLIVSAVTGAVLTRYIGKLLKAKHDAILHIRAQK